MRLPTVRGLVSPLAAFALGAAAAVAIFLATRQFSFSAPHTDSIWSWPFRGDQLVDDGSGESPILMVYEPIALARNIVLIFAGGCICLLGLHRLMVILGFETATPAAPAAKTAALDSARAKLEGEIGNALDLFRSQAASAETHNAALTRGRSSLEESETREQVRTVIKHLVSENERMRRSNADYLLKLEESRFQIESLRAALTESRQSTARDPLTNAFSRGHLDATLSHLVTEAHRFKTSLSVIMADIDHFKGVNDTFGHQIGDDVLKKFVELMMANTKGSDCVARYGGEEFAIVLPSTTLGEAVRIAENIRRKLQRKEWATKGNQRLGEVTASFGVCQLEARESAASLIGRVDAKLYASKTAGRNRVTQ